MLGHWAALLPLPQSAFPHPIDVGSLGTWASVSYTHLTLPTNYSV